MDKGPSRPGGTAVCKAYLRAALGAFFAAALLGAGPAAADPSGARHLIDRHFVESLRDWVEVPLVVLSVNSQNHRLGDLSQAEIEALDRRWRAERDGDDKPIIAATLSNPLSSYLTRIQAHSIGLFTEIFVMDANGLNVGQSNITSDYWQGDEAKWQKTFQAGAGSVFVDEPEFHAESGTWRIQVNLALSDPATRAVIGAVTVEVNLTELARRRALS